MIRPAIREIVVLVSCLILAVLFVCCVNHAYWDSEPYPGGRTARELTEAGQTWVEAGVKHMIHVWSIPLGLAAFFTLYGLAASIMDLGGGVRWGVAATFAYSIIGSLGVLFLIPPLIGVLASASLIVYSVKTKNSRALAFSQAVLAHTIFSAAVFALYVIDLFREFGD